jgi:hypothetical protein
LFLFFCQDSDDMNVRSLIIIPQVPEGWFSFLHPTYSLYCSDQVISILISSSSPTFFCITPYRSAVEPIHELFISVTMFYSSKICIWSFLLPSISLLRLSISLWRLYMFYIKHILNFLLTYPRFFAMFYSLHKFLGTFVHWFLMLMHQIY